VEDVIDTLSTSGTTVLKMVHTHEGAAVGCMLLAYGSAKDRKRLVKAMKGVCMRVCASVHACVCVVAWMDCSDICRRPLFKPVGERTEEL